MGRGDCQQHHSLCSSSKGKFLSPVGPTLGCLQLHWFMLIPEGVTQPKVHWCYLTSFELLVILLRLVVESAPPAACPVTTGRRWFSKGKIRHCHQENRCLVVQLAVVHFSPDTCHSLVFSHTTSFNSPNNPIRKKESVATQLCLTLCNPVNCCPPGSSVHRILQARILE